MVPKRLWFVRRVRQKKRLCLSQRQKNQQIENLSGAERVNQIETETGLRKTTIRQVQKMVQEIATPMNLANTIQYIQSEAKIAKMKIDEPKLDQVVALLLANDYPCKTAD